MPAASVALSLPVCASKAMARTYFTFSRSAVSQFLSLKAAELRLSRGCAASYCAESEDRKKGETAVADLVKELIGEGLHLAATDRRTLEAIFHHPIPHNVSWMDMLHLLKHLGSAEEKSDGKYC